MHFGVENDGPSGVTNDDKRLALLVQLMFDSASGSPNFNNPPRPHLLLCRRPARYCGTETDCRSFRMTCPETILVILHILAPSCQRLKGSWQLLVTWLVG